MAQVKPWVTLPVSEAYWRSLQGVESGSDDESCQKRLITAPRMQAVYESLDFSDEGWGICRDLILMAMPRPKVR